MMGLCTQKISAQDQDSSYDYIHILLPGAKNSYIEKRNKPAGFSIRGTKGWSWTPQQYLEEIPILSKYHLNFMMNCYLSMFSQPFNADSSVKMKNDWWLPVPDSKEHAYEKIFRECRKYGIAFCFALNPQLASSHPLDPASDKDFEIIWKKYSWAQDNGVRWFCVSFDDVSGVKVDGIEHARFVNNLLFRLQKKDPGVHMVFCPTYYAGDGTAPGQKKYLEELSQFMDSSVYVFWTGPQVFSQVITSADAQTFKAIVKHKVILWDNYPVNDGNIALHLAPVTGRDKNLYKIIDGYMSNPCFTENEINRIPLFTMADYAFNPEAYNPEKSIGQAIIHQTDVKAKQQVLLELVQLFSSKIGPSASNTVVDRFCRITALPNSRCIAGSYMVYLNKVQQELKNKFPSFYNAAKHTLAETIGLVEKDYREKYGIDYKIATHN
jgi:hypothetical protein